MAGQTLSSTRMTVISTVAVTLLALSPATYCYCHDDRASSLQTLQKLPFCSFFKNTATPGSFASYLYPRPCPIIHMMRFGCQTSSAQHLAGAYDDYETFFDIERGN